MNERLAKRTNCCDYWKRKGWWYYESHLVWYEPVVGTSQLMKNEVTRHLGFISYHLIRWIHGDEALDRMADAKP